MMSSSLKRPRERMNTARRRGKNCNERGRQEGKSANKRSHLGAAEVEGEVRACPHQKGLFNSPKLRAAILANRIIKARAEAFLLFVKVSPRRGKKRLLFFAWERKSFREEDRDRRPRRVRSSPPLRARERIECSRFVTSHQLSPFGLRVGGRQGGGFKALFLLRRGWRS